MVVEGVWTSEMLSKLLLTVSVGRNLSGSTVMSSNVFMERAYSARFSRWNVRRPGLGFAYATASILVSRASTSARSVSALGRRAPGGGIIAVRSFRIIFSAISPFCSGDATSNSANVKFPCCRRSPWHRVQ